MKDPAVLFYFQDFLVGTEFMTDEEVGKYMRILCHLADKGSLCKSQLLRICKTSTIPEAISEKLLIDENGNYYQRRMREEREKRVNYSESRRINRTKKEVKICKTYDVHMENENENENININEDRNVLLNKREGKFKSEVFEFAEKYPETMLSNFCSYWTELNKSRTKMRFELEKTFEVSKRLATWASRSNDFNKGKVNPNDPDEFLKQLKAIEARDGNQK
jgi:uncharacterized protein YdaU (DUF1376 family)